MTTALQLTFLIALHLRVVHASLGAFQLRLRQTGMTALPQAMRYHFVKGDRVVRRSFWVALERQVAGVGGGGDGLGEGGDGTGGAEGGGGGVGGARAVTSSGAEAGTVVGPLAAPLVARRPPGPLPGTSRESSQLS